jgi:hypothetical protein
VLSVTIELCKAPSYKARAIEQTLTIPYLETMAVVVLPAVGGGQLESAVLRRWLSRADLQKADAPRELLANILERLHIQCPDEGLGALRMWGQTGDRPTVWMAAADPVYLEPRLDHLCLHVLEGDSVPAADLRTLFDHLQETLGDDTNFGFARVGSCGYLCAPVPIATAAMPPYVAHLDKPNDYMPGGDGSAAYRKLLSEVEMSLHDHEVNKRRQDSGLAPINCLWFWGGGYAPEQCAEPYPPLFANDPLLKGHWLSKAAPAASWPGDIAACLDASKAGFVAVAPAHDDPELLAHCLQELHQALRSGRLDRLRLIFRDGVAADIRGKHRWRFWQRNSDLLN